MATRKPTDAVSPDQVTGRWRIVSMSAWDDDFLDEEVEALLRVRPTEEEASSTLATSTATWTVA